MDLNPFFDVLRTSSRRREYAADVERAGTPNVGVLEAMVIMSGAFHTDARGRRAAGHADRPLAISASAYQRVLDSYPTPMEASDHLPIVLVHSQMAPRNTLVEFNRNNFTQAEVAAFITNMNHSGFGDNVARRANDRDFAGHRTPQNKFVVVVPDSVIRHMLYQQEVINGAELVAAVPQLAAIRDAGVSINPHTVDLLNSRLARVGYTAHTTSLEGYQVLRLMPGQGVGLDDAPYGSLILDNRNFPQPDHDPQRQRLSIAGLSEEISHEVLNAGRLAMAPVSVHGPSAPGQGVSQIRTGRG